MSNAELLHLYGLDDKLGTRNNVLKRCKQCGTDNDMNEKTCKTCGSPLPKTKMLSCTKSTALARRRYAIHEAGKHTYKYMHLLSNDLELYEVEALSYEIQENPIKVTISNEKILKSLKGNDDFKQFLKESVPGLYEYAHKAMAQQTNEYAISHFTSLPASVVENLLNVHLNYKALEPYLIPYKVYYFGNRIDLKPYFPHIDFNNVEEVDKLPFNKLLLTVWDLRNPKYIEKIIEISKMNSLTQEVFTDSIKNFMNQLNAPYENRTVRLSYDDIINTYSLVLNSEISVEDFIRIYMNSRTSAFLKIFNYSKMHKKYCKKGVDWHSAEKITDKDINTMEKKLDLLEPTYQRKAFTKTEIEKIYETLAKDPLEALALFKKMSEEKYKD